MSSKKSDAKISLEPSGDMNASDNGSERSVVLQHCLHRQSSPQATPIWKHSQYFFTHPEFLHLHPLECLVFTMSDFEQVFSLNLRENAFGLRRRIRVLASL
jgi:hypothetical protein